MHQRTQEGSTSLEYGLLAALIAGVVFGGVLSLGAASATSWQDSCTKITAPMGGSACP